MAEPGYDGQEELAQFVSAFKEMANNLDEDGARNMLMWSPMFVPTVAGLMNNPFRGGSQAAKPKLKAGMPHELKHPAPRPNSAAAQRQAHLSKLKALYASGGGGAPGAAEDAHAAADIGAGAAPEYVQRGPIQHMPPTIEGLASAQMPVLDENADPSRGAAQSIDNSPRSCRSGVPGSPWAGTSKAMELAKGTIPLDDDWEEEVDDLLNWTTQLPVPDLT